MRKWLRATTIFQRVVLAPTLLALVAAIVSLFASGSSALGLITLALVLCFIAFRRELLWRVRNRLLVTFFLFGVVPIFLIAFMLTLSAELLFGQFATQLVRQRLQTRIESIHSVAQDLALAASHGANADLLNAIRQRTPNLAAVVSVHGNVLLRFPSATEFNTVPVWITPGFGDLFEAGGHYYVGADARDGDTNAFAYLPLDEQFLASLTPGVVSVSPALHGDDRTEVTWGPLGSRLEVVENGVRREILPSGVRQGRSWWDVPVVGLLTWNVRTSSGNDDLALPLISRPSLLLAGGVAPQMASIALSLLFAVAVFLLIVELISLFSSLRLTRAITRSVDDLYRGTLQVAQGDFSHQIPVRGKHQLSELAASFNGMITKIHQLIGEVKKKEKLEAELEIARQVQLKLFPKTVPKVRTLEMAAVCLPGRVVSGDYYDYVPLDVRWTAIALGDVSGKGVSAALLMASVQSALHAQLKFRGASSQPGWSTATLMELLSQQLYESTPPEKYATFFCSVYDDETGRLTYTNAGHLKPILVRAGKAMALEGDGMVAGLFPNVKFEQQEVVLQTGDLLALFSDGIPEAQNAAEEEFGEDRLSELLVTNADKPLDNIISTVTAVVQKWIYDPEGRDDLTLLLLRRL